MLDDAVNCKAKDGLRNGRWHFSVFILEKDDF